MNILPSDETRQSIYNEQARIEQLTKELLSGMSKDELLLIIGKIKANDYYEKINTGTTAKSSTVADYAKQFEKEVDMILSDEYHRNLDGDMFEITTG